MICGKCGKYFPSRGLLISHCCKFSVVPQLESLNKVAFSDIDKNSINDVTVERHGSGSVSFQETSQSYVKEIPGAYQEDNEIPENKRLPLTELAGVEIDLIYLQQNDGFKLDGVNLGKQDPFSMTVRPEENKSPEINEIIVPCSSKTLDLNYFSDMDQDSSHNDPIWGPEDESSPLRPIKITQHVSCNAISQNDKGDNVVGEDSVSMSLPPEENESPKINEMINVPCSGKTGFDLNDLSDEEQDSDNDTTWCPEDQSSHRIKRITQHIVDDEVENEHLEGSENESEGDTTETVNKKRKRGVRRREEEKRKKHLGLPYKNRNGISFPAKEFTPIQQCCRKKCFEKCTPEQQNIIWSNYYKRSPEIRQQVLCERMTYAKCKYRAKGRGTKGGKNHDRNKTVLYSIQVGLEKILVCKLFFSKLHGLTYNQVNRLISKICTSENGYIEVDSRGKHVPSNKLIEERNAIRDYIERCPRNESHYARRDNPNQIFLPTHLTIRQMHEEYKKERLRNGFEKSACYDVFRNVFKQTGYTFKQPYIDTCRKCDEYKTLKRSATNETEKEKLNQLHDEHIKEAENAYDCKRKDKELAASDETKRVLVFDLQQVLPAPFLTTNIVYYKRLLSVFNLTVRDCCSRETSFCFMWHEVIGGRGSDQIASCIHKKILNLPDTVRHVTTYSDTCGGQNRNINMAVMFLYTIMKKPSLEIIDQKFLLPGHTRLECDSDHARIERSKKHISGDFKIMVPRDWYQFVRSLRGKSKFSVIEMTQEDFLAFSKLLSKSLVKRTTDTDGEKVSWLKIKWLRFTNEFGIIKFKYTLDEQVAFKTLDLRRGKPRGRPSAIDQSISTFPFSYSGPLGINPKKKKDLLSMLDLIDKDCHHFYEKLPTTTKAPEFDELEDNVDSGSED